MKISLVPDPMSVLPPKLTPLKSWPCQSMFPDPSIDTAEEYSFPNDRIEPNPFAHCAVPSALKDVKKMSPPLPAKFEIALPFPKSSVPTSHPVSTIEPVLSAATPVARSSTEVLGSPKLFAQSGAPEGEYLTRKMSLLPRLVNVVVPIVMEFMNSPARMTFPEPSSARLDTLSVDVPPSCLAHKH